MLLSWWRRRVKQTQKDYPQSQRRRLAFERLEERCLLSVQPINFGAAGALLPDLPGKDRHAPSVLAADPNAALSFLGNHQDVGTGTAADTRNGAGPGSTSDVGNADTDTNRLSLPVANGRSKEGDDRQTARAQKSHFGDEGSDQQRPPPGILPGDDTTQTTPPASNGDNPPEDENSQTAPPHHGGDSPPEDRNTRKPPPHDQSVPGHDNTQNLPPQDLGDKLPGDDHTPKPPPHGIGIILPGHGRQNALGIGNLLSDGGDAGTRPARLDVRDLSLSVGTLANQVTTLDAPSLCSEGGINADPLVLPHTGSDQLGGQTAVDQNLTPGDSDARNRLNSVLESDTASERSGELVGSWPSGNWTAIGAGQIPDYQIGEAVSDTAIGTVPPDWVNTASLNVSAERLVIENAGVGGTDPVPQVYVYPVSAGIEARFGQAEEMLAGGGNELVEKLTNGTGTLADTLPIAEVLADNGGSSFADLSRRHETLGFALTALAGEAAPWQDLATPGTGLGQYLVNHAARSSSGDPSQGEVFPSFQGFDYADGFELFQSDVAAGGSALGKGALSGSSGATSVYLANQRSSVWSLVATYALVLMPRQRNHQRTILVVDPDDATRDALNVALVREGYFVLPAASVHDAWGMFRTPHARIDLVLLDPHLPDVSGIHLCVRLREISPALPVMVCTRHVEPREVAQLRELGVRYYLRKPIAFAELLHTVKAILP